MGTPLGNNFTDRKSVAGAVLNVGHAGVPSRCSQAREEVTEESIVAVRVSISSGSPAIGKVVKTSGIALFPNAAHARHVIRDPPGSVGYIAGSAHYAAFRVIRGTEIHFHRSLCDS